MGYGASPHVEAGSISGRWLRRHLPRSSRRAWCSSRGAFPQRVEGAECAPDKQVLCFAATCSRLLHMDKQLSPPTKPPRVSVPVTEEVLEVFQRLAKAGNMSTGRAIAEWLGDTVEAAEYMASTMERARAAPKMVMREMHAYALGLADETGDMLRQIAKKGEADRAGGRAGVSDAGADGIPPSCNTGGKLPKTIRKTHKGDK